MPTKKVSETDTPEGRKERLRMTLLARRNELLKESKSEINRLTSTEAEATAMDEGDLSVMDTAEDVNLRKLAAHRDVLTKIDESLRKLDEGTYGTCDDCGEDIAPERLRVLPFAICCRDCQEIREESEAAEHVDEFE